MFTHTKSCRQNGFTLIELLTVMAIIGVLAATVMIAISDSRMSGRDAGRKAQMLEIVKAAELFYTDGGQYPVDGTPADTTTGATIETIGSSFIGGKYISRLPEEPDLYQYCTSSDRKSMLLAVNTEIDKGGSNYCSILRGPGPNYGCTVWRNMNAADLCATRF